MNSAETNGIRRILIRAAGAILAGLVFQTLTIVWWAGGMQSRMGRAEKDLDLISGRVHAMETDR